MLNLIFGDNLTAIEILVTIGFYAFFGWLWFGSGKNE